MVSCPSGTRKQAIALFVCDELGLGVAGAWAAGHDWTRLDTTGHDCFVALDSESLMIAVGSGIRAAARASGQDYMGYWTGLPGLLDRTTWTTGQDYMDGVCDGFCDYFIPE